MESHKLSWRLAFPAIQRFKDKKGENIVEKLENAGHQYCRDLVTEGINFDKILASFKLRTFTHGI